MQRSCKVLWCIVLLSAVQAEDNEITDRLERAKRWLNYPINGGVAKIVLGCVVPIRFHHPLSRVIVNTYNLQANYRIPATIIYPHPESVFQNRAVGGEDQGRRQLFAVLEQAFSRSGRNGRACLLRAVCEVAEMPLKHNGLIGEIIDVIFTPSPSDSPLDPDYLLAQSYGQQGRDCTVQYPDCPLGHGLFDNISFLATQQPPQSARE
uniref:Uncharacterized protein n=1 Tax=Anopheles christyi TaxID=43041 RepID=A0A182JXQ2_9DIPT